MSLQRAFERRRRVNLGEKHPKVLDAHNDLLAKQEATEYLHPRKGFRSSSMKRMRAGLLTAEQKQGKFPPLIIAWQSARMFILTGRYK